MSIWVIGATNGTVMFYVEDNNQYKLHKCTRFPGSVNDLDIQQINKTKDTFCGVEFAIWVWCDSGSNYVAYYEVKSNEVALQKVRQLKCRSSMKDEEVMKWFYNSCQKGISLMMLK